MHIFSCSEVKKVAKELELPHDSVTVGYVKAKAHTEV